MDLLDRLLGHDSWTTRELLLRSRDLSDDQLDREFDMSHRTLRATFRHIVRNVEAWSDLMTDASVRESRAPRQEGQSIPDLIARFDRAAADLAHVARGVARRGAWDELWLDTLDDPQGEKTYGGAIAHVITHSMHHRAQALHMLRRLGVDDLPEGDVLSWEQQAARR
jgi:uncharacterized damage-inducible protein DinB